MSFDAFPKPTTMFARALRPACFAGLFVSAASLTLCGCGTTINRNATEQLLASDAVDRSVENIDFRDLAGQKVFFDTTYIKTVQAVGFVNADYIISSLRQQMVAADCRLQEKREDADFIVEARVGALGADRHEIVWGIPANNLLGTVASAVPNAPAQPPALPEIAFAKKSDEKAVAKIGVFAYHRDTGAPIWQSGIHQSKSTARNTTVFGVGPFQSGTIHDGTEFAGSKIGIPLLSNSEEERELPVAPYNEEVHFSKPNSGLVIVESEENSPPSSNVEQVSGQTEQPAPSPAPNPGPPPAEAPESQATPDDKSAPPEMLPAPPPSHPVKEPAANGDAAAKQPRPKNNVILSHPTSNGWTTRKPAE